MINKSHVASACEPITRLYLRSGEIHVTARRGKNPVAEFLIRNTTKKIYRRSVLSPSFRTGSGKTEKYPVLLHSIDIKITRKQITGVFTVRVKPYFIFKKHVKNMLKIAVYCGYKVERVHKTN